NVEVHLNGQLLYRAGSMSKPFARHCYESHAVSLPKFLLRSQGNQLDLKVVGYPVKSVTARQRAGGLGDVRVGALPDMQALHQNQGFWSDTLAQVMGGILLILGLFALALAWVRKLHYLVYFGLLTLGWSILTGRLWEWPLPLANAQVEMLIAASFAPMTTFAIKFLLGYAGSGVRNEHARRRNLQANAFLLAQCVLQPLTLWW